MFNKNKKNYFILTFIMAVFLFLNINIMADSKEINYNKIAYNIEEKYITQVKDVLNNLSIPYKINKNNNKYNLFIDNDYNSIVLIKLFEKCVNEEKIIKNEELLADKMEFDNNVINILIQDYCNKISNYKLNNNKKYEILYKRTEKALEYYISKQVYNFGDIKNVSININYDDNINFAMIIMTNNILNERNVSDIKRILFDNINYINITHEKVNNDEIIFEGEFDWKLQENPKDIYDIEFENKKSNNISNSMNQLYN